MHYFSSVSHLVCSGALLCVLGFISVGCDIFKEEPAPEADPLEQIQIHAQRFITEAAGRGLNLEEAVMEIEFKVTDTITFQGRTLCGFAPWYDDPDTQQRVITIAVNEECWTGRPEADNEALVFHELGHMILDRFHRDDLLPNNSRASMMVSGNLAGLYVGNASNRRTYYLDELFEPETPAPDWSLVD